MKAVRLNPGLLKEIRAKSAAERQEIGQAIADAQRCLGKPHLHSGIGLRKLRGEFYEVRIGLKKRLVFEDASDALIFELLGSHEEVRRFMRAR